MDIRQFIAYLNRLKGWHIEGNYYAYITQWRQWWQGDYPPFHHVRYSGLDGKIHTRELYRLRMPKRLCEDWASLLLNDKTTVTLGDEASAVWLCGGVDCQQTGGVLGRLAFWPNANRLVELAFRSGTGAFLLSVQGVAAQDGRLIATDGARLSMDYLPAECVLPITVQHGQVTEVAFASEVISGGRSCIYLQTHRLVSNPDNGGEEYEITNEYFTSESKDSEGAAYRPEPLPRGMLAKLRTGSALPWFAIFSPAVVKNLDGGPGLGMAVFSEAIDACRQVDLAFDNYCRDLFLGGKKVFYSREMLKPMLSPDGKTVYAAPDELRNQLFWSGMETEDDGKPVWQEYNPDLRVEANGQAVQDALNYASFLSGLGTHRYQFQAGTIATATQYMGDRQDMVQHANRHQIPIEAALLTLFRSMLWVGRNLLGVDIDPETEITVHFDDSYFDTADSRRAQDKDDCLSGFLPKYRYNMEWRGMSAEEAKAAVREAQEEAGSRESLTFYR